MGLVIDGVSETNKVNFTYVNFVFSYIGINFAVHKKCLTLFAIGERVERMSIK